MSTEESTSPNGWWETSAGAEFGAAKLNELLTYLRGTDARIAELERKLAEQPAIVKKLHGYTPASWLDDCSGVGFEELSAFLAKAKEEGRREAVPEGWQVVPKEASFEMEVAWNTCNSPYWNAYYDAMLAAAPKPDEAE